MTPMAKKKKKRDPKKDLLQVELGAVRDEQKAQGALDGRFRSKVVPNKKRKPAPKTTKDVDHDDL